MKLVSSQSDDELRKQRATAHISWLARDLTANLLRISRGAGKPYEVIRQAAALVTASHDFKEEHGVWPDFEIAEAIRFDREYYRAGMSEADLYIELGQKQAVQGALQLVASEMLGQRTQVAAGRSELFDGIINVEKGRELNRRQYAPKPFSARARPRKPKPKSKPKG